MELWIRSQNKKKLCKATSFELDNDETAIFANNYDGDYVCAGKYKTKERALEILDEIQEIIKPTIITTDYECKCEDNPNDKLSFNLRMEPQKTTIQELSTYVYEMPKE